MMYKTTLNQFNWPFSIELSYYFDPEANMLQVESYQFLDGEKPDSIYDGNHKKIKNVENPPYISNSDFEAGMFLIGEFLAEETMFNIDRYVYTCGSSNGTH